MNKHFRLMMAALIGLSLLGFNASAQCPGNLIASPGFESNLNGWTVVGPASLATDAHSGSHAADLSSASYGSIGYVLPATPGTSYTMSAWTKYTCSVELRFLNSSWNKLPGSVEQQSVSVFYQQTTLSGTAPAGTAYVYVFFAKDGNGSFLVDDACLTVGGTTALPDLNLSSFLAVQNNGQAGSSVITANSQVAAGTPISFVDHLAYLTFPQPVPSFNSVIAAYLSTDATLSANDVLIVSTALNINANVQSFGFTEGPFGNGTIASNTTPGNYFIIVKYDATDLLAESDEANNFKTLPIVVTGGNPMPDLSGILHEFIPGNVCYTAPGQSFGFISMQINNMGTAAATAFKVKFYFSTDNALSANDVLWVTENVPSLGLFSNGGPVFVSPTQPVPASLPMGQYYVIVTIDGDNQVAESNESNNTITPFTVQIGAADVTMQGVAGVPASAPAGSSFTVQVTAKYVSNGFSFPAGTGFPVDVVVTDISPFQTIGTVNFNLSEFASSNAVTKSVQVNVPATLAVGAHNFRFAANPAFCEPKGPTNWQDKSINVTSGSGNGIDLELAMQQNTANPVIYSHYTTTATLVNKGPQAATGVKVKWAKPAGVVYTGGNEFTASQGSFNPNGDQIWTVGSIPANGSATLSVSYFLLQNGAPVTYAQVIAADQTDVDSQPNNGTPPTPNQDDEASTGGSAPPVLTPDLTISNLEITNAPVQPGQILGYYFDLANIGNGNAPQDFIVRAWISTSPTFNTSGVQDGVVPTGNFIAGFSVTEVPGASTLPANLTPGQYYLHLWVDADQQVNELNENNNTVSKGFLIVPSPQSGSCYELAGPGGITCVEQATSGDLNISYGENGMYEMATLDASGQISNVQPTSPPTVFPTYRVLSGYLEKLLGSTVVYSQPIPTAISSGYDYILGFTERSNGYVLLGFIMASHEMFAIRTDANLNVQQTAMIGVYAGYGPPSINTISPIGGNGFAFTANYYPGPLVNTFVTVNSNLEVVTSEVIQYTYWYGSAGLYQTGCGKFSLNSAFSNYQHRGSWFGQTIREGHFENGVFIKEHVYETSEQTSMGTGSRSYSWELFLTDGSTIRGSNSQPIFYLGAPIDNIVYLVKKQGNTVIWEKYVEVSSAANIRRIALSGDELVFISQVNNAVFIETINCLEPANPKPDLFAWQGYAYPTTIPVGSDFITSNTVLNMGTAVSPGFNVKYYLSADLNFSPSNDIFLSQLTFQPIAPGGSGNQSPQLTMPFNVPSGNYFLLMVADPDNFITEENESNNVVSVAVTVTGGNTQPNCAANNITAGTNSLTIANATAPHVLIKVFNPNWTLNDMCLDNCANPWTLNNLNAGTYHLQVKLLDAGWGEICYLEQDLAVNGFGGSNANSLARSDERQRLSLDRCYPSPASYQVNVELFSPVEQAATLDFYDQLGRPEQTVKLQLEKGSNTLPVLVYDWKSGGYNVIARGEQTQLPAYGRFLKVWEE